MKTDSFHISPSRWGKTWYLALLKGSLQTLGAWLGWGNAKLSSSADLGSSCKSKEISAVKWSLIQSLLQWTAPWFLWDSSGQYVVWLVIKICTHKNPLLWNNENVKIPLDNIMKSSQHAHEEGNGSRGKWCVLRKVTGKDGSRTRSKTSCSGLGFHNKKTLFLFWEGSLILV